MAIHVHRSWPLAGPAATALRAGICAVLAAGAALSMAPAFAQSDDAEICRRMTVDIFRLEEQRLRLSWRQEANGRAMADVNQALGMRNIAEGLCAAGELTGDHEVACAALQAAFVWLTDPQEAPDDARRWCEQSACEFLRGVEPLAQAWFDQVAALGADLERDLASIDRQIRDLYVALDGRSCAAPEYDWNCGRNLLGPDDLPDWSSSMHMREAVQDRCWVFGFSAVFRQRFAREGCAGGGDAGLEVLFDVGLDFSERQLFCPRYNACIGDFLAGSGDWATPAAAWRSSQDDNVGAILARAQSVREGCPGVARRVEHYWTH